MSAKAPNRNQTAASVFTVPSTSRDAMANDESRRGVTLA
jgi:hypothetical protein